TANARGEDYERCIAAGMDDYLTKPLTLDELRAALDRWVGRRSAATASAARDGVAADEAIAVGAPPAAAATTDEVGPMANGARTRPEPPAMPAAAEADSRAAAPAVPSAPPRPPEPVPQRPDETTAAAKAAAVTAAAAAPVPGDRLAEVGDALDKATID